MVHDGQGLPLPYGEDGSYLILKDGEPAWTDVPDPDPDPVGDGVTWNNINEYKLYNENNQEIVPPDILATAQSQACWLNTDYEQRFGLGRQATDILETGINLSFENMYGKILRLYWNPLSDITVDGFPMTITYTVYVDQENIVPITSIPGGTTPNIESEYWGSIQADFLFNREVPSATFSYKMEATFSRMREAWFRGWEIIDPGTYAFEQQQKMKGEIDEIRNALRTQLNTSNQSQS